MKFTTLRNVLVLSITTILVITGISIAIAENNVCIEVESACQIRTDCTINENFKPKILTNKRCERFLEYYKDLYETSNRYSTPTLKLTPSILSAIIDRESLWLYGLKPNTCEGYGDHGWGHGLVQIDGYYTTPFLGKYGKNNTAVAKKTLKYGMEKFKWSSCNESIKYLGAYLLSIEEIHSSKLISKLQRSNLNLNKKEDKSFVDKKVEDAYLKLILNSYNAGPTGTFVKNTCSVSILAVVTDNCTTGKNYATDVLNRAKEFKNFESTSKVVTKLVAK
jgi:hypothetical protein